MDSELENVMFGAESGIGVEMAAALLAGVIAVGAVAGCILWWVLS